MSLGLLSSLFPMAKGVRLLGVTLSSLNTDEESEGRQLSLGL
jgi:DNA polymerase-4